MTATIDELEKRLEQLKEEVPTRGIERHPIILEKIGELSAELHSPSITALESGRGIQTIIEFPPQMHQGTNYVPKQALAFTEAEIIHILASIWPHEEPRVTTLKGKDLLYMDVTLILLYGFLDIAAEGPKEPTRLKVEFNGVAWDSLSEPLRRFLQTTKAVPASPTDKASYSPEAAKAAEKLPTKFSNGLRLDGLLPGEELEDLVFQPGKWERRFLFLRKPTLASTLMLLTSNFVAIIREKLGFHYGWIVTYIPRKNILGIRNQPQGMFNQMTMQLKRGEQTAEYPLTLTDEAAGEWRGRLTEHGYSWKECPEEE